MLSPESSDTGRARSQTRESAGQAGEPRPPRSGGRSLAESHPPTTETRGIHQPVIFFDTTLRDGEQSPGCSLSTPEKLRVAHQLARLGVDVIEAGFPASSPGDLEAVGLIAREVEGPVISGLARCKKNDILTCWEAVKRARHPRIHTFVSTSDIHLEHQMRLSREGLLDLTRDMVGLAASLNPRDVQFSAMDATRSHVDFLAAVLATAIRAGATTVNLSDTVGYALPLEFARLIDALYEKVPGMDEVILSVHCHDDLGLATANSLSAVRHGVTQVEVAVNGLGERAGVAALEEVAMALVTRADVLERPCNIVTTEIARTSRLVSRLTGQAVQANKAVVGKNAFAHESGIHQDGVLKERSTYEIMRPDDVGLTGSDIVLGKHSGRHALMSHLRDLGIHLHAGAAEADDLFARFKDLADRKRQVSSADLRALVAETREPENHCPTCRQLRREAGPLSPGTAPT